MSDTVHDLIAGAIDHHREQQREHFDSLVTCACGWERAPKDVVGPGTYRAHVAGAVLAVLRERGIVLCRMRRFTWSVDLMGNPYQVLVPLAEEEIG